MISISPTQKVGSEKPTMLAMIDLLENRRSAASARDAQRQADHDGQQGALMASSSVAGRRWKISSIAGTL